jgi:hypothetical protein
MIKPGYRTSEFWFTLVSFLFSGLFLLGIIGDNQQKEELIRDVSHGVESIILIGGQVLILWNYVNSRNKIKEKYTPPIQIETPQTIPEPPVVPIKSKRKKTTKKNTKKKSSPKS